MDVKDIVMCGYRGCGMEVGQVIAIPFRAIRVSGRGKTYDMSDIWVN